MMNVYYFEWQKCQYIPYWRFHVCQVSVKAVVHGTQRIWFIFSTILFEYTQENSSHNTVKVFGGICPSALSSPIEVKKSMITFMSLFVFVLVLLFKFSSKKPTSYLFLYYHTKPFVWYDIFFLIVGILVQVCWQISG